MTLPAPIMMFGWIPAGLALFALLPARRALIAGVIGAWLFLPVASWPVHGLPDWDKTTAVAVVVLAGALLFDAQRVMRFRPGWIDVPVVCFCCSPFITSLWGGLGIHDGVSAVFAQTVAWGIPYGLGRVYCSDAGGAEELTRGFVWGGLAYVPVCVFEMVFGPHAHELLYGFYQADLTQALRMGGWRPIAFMANGLMVAFWMASAAIAAFVLWRQRRTAGWQAAAAVLIPMGLLMRSVNGWIVLALGIAMWMNRHFARAAAMMLLVAIPAYVGVRAGGEWGGEQLVRLIARVSAARAQSVEFRFENEDAIASNARESVVWGLGRGSAMFVDRQRGGIAVPDSLWIIVFGRYGAVGLLGMLGTLLMPVLFFVRRYPPGTWRTAAVAPGVALAVVVLLQAMDHMVNASINPAVVLATGAVAGLALAPPVEASDA